MALSNCAVALAQRSGWKYALAQQAPEHVLRPAQHGFRVAKPFSPQAKMCCARLFTGDKTETEEPVCFRHWLYVVRAPFFVLLDYFLVFANLPDSFVIHFQVILGRIFTLIPPALAWPPVVVSRMLMTTPAGGCKGWSRRLESSTGCTVVQADSLVFMSFVIIVSLKERFKRGRRGDGERVNIVCCCS